MKPTVQYCVFAKAGVGTEADFVCIAESFNRLAFFLPPVWALSRRLWWIALGTIAIGQAPFAIAESVAGDAMLGLPVFLCLAYWLAGEASALEGWILSQKGYQFSTIVSASTEEEADILFMAKLVENQTRFRSPIAQ